MNQSIIQEYVALTLCVTTGICTHSAGLHKTVLDYQTQTHMVSRFYCSTFEITMTLLSVPVIDYFSFIILNLILLFNLTLFFNVTKWQLKIAPISHLKLYYKHTIENEYK